MQASAHWMLLSISAAAAILTGGIVAGYVHATPGEKKESIEARLQRLEDREDIRQLLMDYGRFLDQRDFAAFSQLFAEKEGEWIGGMGSAKSPQAIRKLMEDTIGKDTMKVSAPNRHVFTNEIITVNGDRANATTKWMFVVQGETKRPQPFFLGHYEDSFVRENGRWKFLRRVVYADIPADDPLARK